MTDEPKTRTKGGKPRKYASDAKRPTLTFRVRGGLHERLKASADHREFSISEEIERRLDQSFDDDAMRTGLSARYVNAERRVTGRIKRAAMSMPENTRGTPLNHELNTRREWHAAIDVLKHAYAPTEAERPEDPVVKLVARPWGSGDHGRLYAYNWLEFDGDDLDALDEAKSTRIDDWWTGDGSKVLGDFVEEGMLTAEQASKRMFPEGEPAPLVLPRDAIPVSDESRPSDSGPDDGDKLPLDLPADKPKRGRKAKPKT